MTYPILAAIAVAWIERMDLSKVTSFLENLSPTPGRRQPVVLKNGVTVLRDDYKSPIETVETALDAFGTIPANRRLAVIGKISELPGKRGPTYRWLGEKAANVADKMIFIGGKRQLSSFRSGVKNVKLSSDSVVYHAKNIKNAISVLKKLLMFGDLVLLKGRNAQKLQRIVLGLEGKAVRCELRECTTKLTTCDLCPMLESGWSDGRTVF